MIDSTGRDAYSCEMRPNCECHDVPMTKRNDTPKGWRCSVAHREAVSIHGATFEGWIAKSRRNARRYATPELRDQAAAELAAVRDEIRKTEAALAALTTEVA